MSQNQNYKNHAKFFPLFHFIASPILLIYFVWSLVQFRYGFTTASFMTAFLAFGLVALALAARTMALKVQDRVIRLEMRLRLREMLPAAMHADIARLTADQLIGLRFAGDAELPTLCREVLEGKLASRKDIKMRIQNWQGDYLRA